MTQVEAANLLNVSLRSYKTYENDESKVNTIKYEYMLNKLKDVSKIDEENGILSIKDISEKLENIFDEYKIEYCYLFGSYAKGRAKGNSDVDLLISDNVKGIKYFGLVEKIKNTLHKNVDLLDIKQLNNNQTLLNEILKNGKKIYG